MMAVMARRMLPWLLALPLMAAGPLFAHSLAYALVEPGAAERARLLRSTGHGYLAAAPVLLAGCAALALAATVAYAVRARRGDASPLPACPLALVPLAGFALQEQVERLSSGAPLDPLEPTFLVGLALQVPFAAAAVLVARRLARVAESLGRERASAPPRLRAREAPVRAPRSLLAPLPEPALAHPERGPPSR
jgi:hypothetical protein